MAVMYVTKRCYRRWQRLSLASLALAASIACSRTTEPVWSDGFWSANDVWSGQIILTPNTDAPHWPSDPVTIHAAEVKGDSLELTVSFGGGCRDHAFALLADAAWMESYPVQIGVRLAHDARDDACKALLSRVLRFDLAPLKAAYATSYQAASGIIRLNVRGAPASPTYSW
jgi:hypothetical protein